MNNLCIKRNVFCRERERFLAGPPVPESPPPSLLLPSIPPCWHSARHGGMCSAPEVHDHNRCCCAIWVFFVQRSIKKKPFPVGPWKSSLLLCMAPVTKLVLFYHLLFDHSNGEAQDAQSGHEGSVTLGLHWGCTPPLGLECGTGMGPCTEAGGGRAQQ